MPDVDARRASRVARLPESAFIRCRSARFHDRQCAYEQRPQSQASRMAGSASFHTKQPARCHGKNQPESNVGPLEMERHETFRFQR
jgi:hypothetical protein